jgi:hypothetical protein
VKLVLEGSDDGVQHPGLLGFRTLSIVQYSEEYVLETGSVSVLGGGGETPALFGLLERANPNHWTVGVSHPLI